tara:strand:+ start:3378 stop:3995 length:618 start_codon:yes stop_codon:yes gene_type:complete
MDITINGFDEIIGCGIRLSENKSDILKEFDNDLKKFYLIEYSKILNHKLLNNEFKKLTIVNEKLDSLTCVLLSETNNLMNHIKLKKEDFSEYPIYYSSCLGKNVNLENKREADLLRNSINEYFNKILKHKLISIEAINDLNKIYVLANKRQKFDKIVNNEVYFDDYLEYIKFKIRVHNDILDKIKKLSSRIKKIEEQNYGKPKKK